MYRKHKRARSRPPAIPPTRGAHSSLSKALATLRYWGRRVRIICPGSGDESMLVGGRQWQNGEGVVVYVWWCAGGCGGDNRVKIRRQQADHNAKPQSREYSTTATRLYLIKGIHNQTLLYRAAHSLSAGELWLGNTRFYSTVVRAGRPVADQNCVWHSRG